MNTQCSCESEEGAGGLVIGHWFGRSTHSYLLTMWKIELREQILRMKFLKNYICKNC